MVLSILVTRKGGLAYRYIDSYICEMQIAMLTDRGCNYRKAVESIYR